MAKSKIQLKNTPAIKVGVVGVSRDCFPISLTKKRLDVLMRELQKTDVTSVKCTVVIENDEDAMKAVAEVVDKDCDAAVVYLGNFGPEGPTSLFAESFPGPVMVCAAAEESKRGLAKDRGDALCGLLSCSYNLGLRRRRVHIPQHPVGTPTELAAAVEAFVPMARAVTGVRNLKIFSFGPRPHDFLACNAPIQPLFDLGIEVMENSELDLLQLYQEAAGKKRRIQAVERDMKKELGRGAAYPDLLPRLAQFEVALVDFFEQNLGACEYGVFANKCWPAFERAFGFVPCYVNSRLAGRGIPAACEVDLYGALSEYIVQLVSLKPATLLDVNNSVPSGVVPKRARLKGAAAADLFMGFHCGNTAADCMKDCGMKYQLIMNRLMEDGKEPDITRGTLEGRIRPGPITMFRLQSTSDGDLQSYAAEGEVLDVDPCTFGGTGVVAIPGFARFYRHVLIARRFPHHAAFGFAKVGETLFDALKLLGVDDIGVPLPKDMLYPGENPWSAGIRP